MQSPAEFIIIALWDFCFLLQYVSFEKLNSLTLISSHTFQYCAKHYTFVPVMKRSLRKDYIMDNFTGRKQ